MSTHSDFAAYLAADAAIVAAAAGGIFHEVYPQDQETYPVLVFQMVSNTEIDFDMDYPAGAKLNTVRYQLDTYGTSSAQAVDAADAIDAVLIAFSGLMGSTRVQRIERTGMLHAGEVRGDKQRRRVSADYSIWF